MAGLWDVCKCGHIEDEHDAKGCVAFDEATEGPCSCTQFEEDEEDTDEAPDAH